MKTYGLLGFPLGHSFSAGFFANKFSRENITDCQYLNFEYSSPVDFIAHKPDTLAGFNVTIPHKQSIIPLLHSLDPAAEEIGAVNCVKMMPDQTLRGYNTDAYGFEISLLAIIGDQRPSALVLGSGGASKAICFTLTKLGITYSIVSRSGELNYTNLTTDIVANSPLIINTTPLGMYPQVDTAPPIPYQAIGKQHLLYDLVYNPTQTMFLKNGRTQGACITNGLEMLRLQAIRSWEIWMK